MGESKLFQLILSVLAALFTLLLVGVVFLVGFATGRGASPGNLAPLFNPALPAARSVDTSSPEFDVLWEAWGLVEERHFDPLPSETERVHGAIEGMLRTLDDPHTAFIPPDMAQLLDENVTGSFEGIGAYVEQGPEGGVQIIRVFEGGPADQAGVRPGDLIVAVDGQDVTEMALNEALLLVRGPSGSQVTLTLLRGEEQLIEITVTRARIEVPTVEARMLEDDVAYVALFEFNQLAAPRLEAAVDDLLKNQPHALILDLRNNPGGLLDQSVEVSDLFLPEGTVVIQRDADGGERVFESEDGDIAEGIPLVVLVNGFSASASEIVAGAMQDRGRAVLIGETTFGKGSVQGQYHLSDGSLLRITEAEWFTPNGTSISETGVTPDIVVPTPEAEEEVEGDPQLERAIEYILSEE
jgi:carboxyl-terminal processing protease